jgi:hypothetical protein
MKTCTKCKETKTLEEFANAHRVNSKNEHIVSKRSTCRKCDNLKRKKNYDSKPITRMLMNAKSRARQYGFEFNITLEDVPIPKICPILEVELVLGEAHSYEYAPSIDRLDSNLGYVKGNVRVVSLKANRMKSNATVEECLKFAKNIKEYLKIN